MNICTVTEAKAHLSALLARVEGGEEIVITRRGIPVARLSPIRAARHPPDWQAVRAFRKSMPAVETLAVDLVRGMRDQAIG